MRATWVFVLFVASLFGGCQSSGVADFSGLAERDPLPYSVLVTGGTFVVAPSDRPDARALDRTYRLEGEAFPLGAIVDVLQRARVFVRTEQDMSDALSRRAVASFRDRPEGSPERDAALAAARDDGHDFLLVVERLQDGPVEKLGINGQWPITAAVWLMLGLGLVIPDHSFESRANLRVSLHEAQTGTVVHDTVLSGGAVDLSLVERTDFLGLVTSILVPPFWVGDDDRRVENNVRDTATRRLLESTARQLKSVEVSERIDERMPAQVAITARGDGHLVTITSQEGLSYVRIRIDGRPLTGAEFDAFAARLMRSQERTGDVLRYAAEHPRFPSGRRVQVLLQTVAGRAASITFDRESL